MSIINHKSTIIMQSFIMNLTITYTITLLLLILPVNNGFRVELSHVDSKSNFTKFELINRAVARSRQRLSRLTASQLFSSTNINSTINNDNPLVAEYFMNLAIGNPPLNYSAILDTGSDLIWTQCTPCKKCVFQPTPIYNPLNSTTVSSIPCNNTLYTQLCNVDCPPPSCLCSYYYPYGTGWTRRTLKKETFTFGTTEFVSIPNIVFGCSTSTSDDQNGIAGLVGFGRGSFSLPSQLNTSMFSYCFTSSFNDVDITSTLFIGPSTKFSENAIKSTPFIKNPRRSPMSTYYYVSLQGISLGTTKLSIEPSTFALQSNGTGGVIIDSGTTFTQLANEAYEAVRNAIDSTMELPRVNASVSTTLDLCYYLPANSSLPTMPNMTFHFESVDMVLSVDNYMVGYSYNQEDLWCLAMTDSDSSQISPSILGNYQQQNFHFLYDLDKEILSFYPVQCGNL